ncbi:hypothetical protein NKH77_11080 [Streptomyces sp. M19]
MGADRRRDRRHAPPRSGPPPHDRRLADLVGELTLRSPEFSTWWNDHRVLRRTHGAKHYHHPVAGELHFSYESFQVPGDSDQTLCVYNVEPGSPSAEALRLLDSWTAPSPAPPPRRRVPPTGRSYLVDIAARPVRYAGGSRVVARDGLPACVRQRRTYPERPRRRPARPPPRGSGSCCRWCSAPPSCNSST